MNNWQELEKKYFFRTINRTPVTIARGEGTWVWDDRGTKYLDFVAGWAVDSLGHCHPALVQAITEQAKCLIQASNQFYTIPQIQLAELLVQHSCLDRVFFCNSGAEADEGAVKLARKYGGLHLKGAYEVITTFNSFHGRTLAMVAATGQQKFQRTYVPLPSGFVNVDYDSIDAIKKATNDKTCAVMLEPIQGEGGVNVPHDNYLAEVRQWCDEKGILLILDEIQTGLGRTGTLFGYQQHGVEPDIMTLAKGLGSGVPIGAILAKERASVFEPGDHGSTYGGNPLCCAAGYATLKFILDNDIPTKAKSTGQYFMTKLQQLKSKSDSIVEVRGRGLLIAMGFNKPMADKMLRACLTRRLLTNAVKPDVLRFIPPLTVSRSEVDQAVNIVTEALLEVDKEISQ